MRLRTLFLAALVGLALAPTPSFAQVGPVLDDLRQARTLYTAPLSKAQQSELLARGLAAHPIWRLLRKSGGNVCPTPYPGVEISCDWVVDAASGWGWDVVKDAEGASVVEIGNSGAIAAGVELVAPWPVSGTTPGGGGNGGGTGGNASGAATRADLQEFEDRIVARSGNLAADVIAAIDRMMGCTNGLDRRGVPCASMLDNFNAIDGKLEAIHTDVNNPGFWKKLKANPLFRYGSVGLIAVLLKQYGGALIPDSATSPAPVP